jgi:hypothetical protein
VLKGLEGVLRLAQHERKKAQLGGMNPAPSIQGPVRKVGFNGIGAVCSRSSSFETIYAPSKQLERNIDSETQFEEILIPDCPILAVTILNLGLQVFEVLHHLLMAHALSGRFHLPPPPRGRRLPRIAALVKKTRQTGERLNVNR